MIQSAAGPPVRSRSTALPERFSLDHHADIARAAYFRAERRGFARGHEIEDWLEAENELRRRFIGQGRQP